MQTLLYKYTDSQPGYSVGWVVYSCIDCPLLIDIGMSIHQMEEQRMD